MMLRLFLKSEAEFKDEIILFGGSFTLKSSTGNATYAAGDAFDAQVRAS